MQGQYQLLVYSVTGTQVAVLTNWQKLTYRNEVNGPGSWQLDIGQPSGAGLALDTIPSLFTEDAIIVVRRRLPDAGIDWYTDFTGLTRDTALREDAAGNLTFTAKGAGPLDLAARRVVAYAAGTKFAEKRGPSSTVIAAYVDENLGAIATTANGRYASGVTANWTTAVASGAGATWEGARHMQSILTVIQGISVQTADVEFYVTATVGGGSVAWVFNTTARIGTDRRASVIFSRPFGNMADDQYSVAKTAARNRAYVLGPGEKRDRIVITVNNAALQAGSPWALSEMTREATQESTGLALSNVGATALEGARPYVDFSFLPVVTQATRYGREYFLGDTVTAIAADGTSLSLRVIGVTITSDGPSGLETIELSVRVLR